jgi:putative ABC transport system permease protein
MTSLSRDLRYAARTLLRDKGFTLIAVSCLALGIGINSTIYSAVHAILVRPLPYHDPGKIVSVGETYPKEGWVDSELSFLDYLDIRAQTKDAFEDVAIYSDRFVNYEEMGASGDVARQGAEGIEAATVSAHMFPMLGIRPVLGRHFREEEDRPGAPRVAMLGYELWRSRYALDSSIVGRSVRLNGEPTQIIGIMPARFGWFDEEDLFVPLALDPARENRGSHFLEAVGRLKPGVSMDRANEALAAVAARVAEEAPMVHAGRGFGVIPIREHLVPGEVKLVVSVMMGAVMFVLLIACANVANLLLSRATARQKEIAIRTALGARRGRIVRQLLTESVLIGAIGGALGILLAVWGNDLVMSQIPEELPNWMDIKVDRGVVIFTALIAVATGLVFGVVPAIESSRPNLNETLKDGGRGTSVGGRRGRLRSGLVVLETALALVLLIGATLMMRSFLHLKDRQPGFETASQLTTRLYLSNDRFPDVASRVGFFRAAMERLGAIPGVEAVGAINYLPLSGSNTGSSFQVEGQPTAPGQAPMASWRPITRDYFRSLGMREPRGRAFTDAEVFDTTARVAIINQAMADRFWPKQEALGRRFSSGLGPDAEWLTVVGVVPTVQLRDLDTPPENQFYLPYAHAAWRTMSIILRVRGDPAGFAPLLRRAVAEVDPTLPLFEVQTMSDVARLSYWDKRLYGLLFGSFALIALVLAAIGVYGVMSYAVSQRTHEIGVRVALGAQLRDVLGMVVRRGVLLTLLGLAIGLVGAFGLTRVLAGVLFGVSPTDPLSYIGISLVLFSVALIASYVPARRAAKVEPAVALRYE